ncbi:hypothetical protein B0H13DRAFT_1893314 [Mycena leptocephala]|nr:hypothetical protein B0H13DRAFT_1893314 [Mycena leptocephala]
MKIFIGQFNLDSHKRKILFQNVLVLGRLKQIHSKDHQTIQKSSRPTTKAVETQELEAGTDCDRPSNQKVTASKEFPGPKEGRTDESRKKLAPGKMGARPYLCVESPRVISRTILSQLDGKLLNHWVCGLAMNDWYKRGQKVGHETGRSGKKHTKGGLEGVKQSGWAEEEGKSKNIWGNSTAEEPFA